MNIELQKVYKENKFLVFETVDNKNVKYDLSNGDTYGLNGRKVKSLQSQLRGYRMNDIVDLIDNDNYKNFINFVYETINKTTDSNNYRGSIVDKYSNIGTILSKVKTYANYEQYFAANIKLNKYDNLPKTTPLKDIPKGLIKLSKEYNFELDTNILRAYNTNKDLFQILLPITKELHSIFLNDIINLLYGINYNNYYSHNRYNKFIELTNKFNYNMKSLLLYIDSLITYEGLRNFDWVLDELYDYVTLESKMSDKFEKYPRYFLTTHQVTVRNWDRLKKEYSEKIFASRVDKKLEYKIGDYKFIYPTYTQDIKDEAVQQHNCVAGYIDDVIDGKCHIMFLRKKDMTVDDKDQQWNKSLVTLEIRDYKVVQERGERNRVCTKKEEELIEKFNKHLEKVKNKREGKKDDSEK